jgi:cytochrome c oxidase subunit IV
LALMYAIIIPPAAILVLCAMMFYESDYVFANRVAFFSLK